MNVFVDAITLLKQDHKDVNAMFRRFEKLGDNAYETKREVVAGIVRALSMHAAIEEGVLYPAVKGISDDLKDHVLESLEEHHVVKWLLSELEDMDPRAERFDAKVTVLIENVRHHVEEEEQEFFPAVREQLGRKVLTELGDLLEQAKRVAPTHPHPRSPDEPPMNAVATMVSGLIDRARDAGVKAVKASTRRARATSGPATRERTTRPAAKRTARSTTTAAGRTGRQVAKAAKRTAPKAAKRTATQARATARRAVKPSR